MKVLELLGIALAPGVAITLFIYLKDKHEREPFTLLLISFLFGIMSTFITVSVSEPLNFLIMLKSDDVIDQFIEAFFKVALIEEASKFLFVRFILYPNKNFNEPFDGIVYAVMVSMGFATLENILYVFEYGFETGLYRMFTAVPAHATFGVMMGYYLGKGKFAYANSWFYAALALIIPTLFHGAYDYFWMIAEVQNVWTGIWIFAMVSLIVGLVLSRNAIKLHQQASPFIAKQNKQPERPSQP
jgi:RsiW-degrading membrane proteinase PrsW (M82 family)